MIDFVHNKLFLQNSIPKKFFIISDTATITNTELHQEKLSLKEALCSESELVLGSCEASEIEFTVSNIFTPQTGKELTVKMVVNKDSNNPFNVGKYKVYSDKPTANRKDRVIKAYDAMHDIINSDVTDWYNRVLPKGSAVTVKQFRDSFISYFGLEQEDITLINDDIILNRTIEPAKLSGKDVITKLCEMNGCFGHIGRNGKFKYIYLRPADEGLYPREDLYPSENLFPKETSDYWIPKRNCISASSEDYIVERITRIQIRQDEDDIGGGAGVEGNDYIIQDNFLLYGKDSKELNTIAQRILDKVGGIYYRPFNATVKGNPCAEVGDPILISGKYENIQSYVLERTLTGIQSLRDKISASGSPSREDKVNGSQSQIIQLQGRYNKLSRTVEETRSEIGNIEEGLHSEIVQTAEEIRAEVEDTRRGLVASISATADQIRIEAAGTYETIEAVNLKVGNALEDAESYTDTKLTLYSTTKEMNSAISTKADEINLSVNGKITETVAYIDGSLENYYTITEVDNKISVNEEGILLSVSKTYETISNASSNYKSLQSQIDVNAGNISLKVSSGEVQSMIDVSLENITLTASQISLEGYTTVNNGFSIDTSGNAILKSGSYTAQMTGSSFTVGSPGTYSALSGNSLTFTGNNGALNGISKINGKEVITPDNISSYVTDYSYNISLLESKVSELDTDVSNALSDAQTALDGVSDNGTEIIYIKSDIDDLEDAVGGVESDITNIYQNLNGLGTITSYLQGRVADLSSRIDALEKAL